FLFKIKDLTCFFVFFHLSHEITINSHSNVPEIVYNSNEAARCRRRITRRAAFPAFLSRRGGFPRAPGPQSKGKQLLEKNHGAAFADRLADDLHRRADG
ncbi:hypothetical protein, partial [Victivallis sp.]|uniref:hypothetical protein n=1 Tax=Victivallis sp. TaxID=2049020 RepID=UPI003A8F8FDC